MQLQLNHTNFGNFCKEDQHHLVNQDPPPMVFSKVKSAGDTCYLSLVSHRSLGIKIPSVFVVLSF
ncbi:unnamed protein product [Brassica oleracea var. botrytis]